MVASRVDASSCVSCRRSRPCAGARPSGKRRRPAFPVAHPQQRQPRGLPRPHDRQLSAARVVRIDASRDHDQVHVLRRRGPGDRHAGRQGSSRRGLRAQRRPADRAAVPESHPNVIRFADLGVELQGTTVYLVGRLTRGISQTAAVKRVRLAVARRSRTRPVRCSTPGTNRSRAPSRSSSRAGSRCCRRWSARSRRRAARALVRPIAPLEARHLIGDLEAATCVPTRPSA